MEKTFGQTIQTLLIGVQGRQDTICGNEVGADAYVERESNPHWVEEMAPEEGWSGILMRLKAGHECKEEREEQNVLAETYTCSPKLE